MKTVVALVTFEAYPEGQKELFEEGGEYQVSADTAKAWELVGRVTIKPAARKPQKNTDADA